MTGSPFVTDPGTGRTYDHLVETPSEAVAVVSDRGLGRVHNDDTGTAVTGDGWAGLVVCDGVGSRRGGDLAARAATAAAREAMLAELAVDDDPGAGADIDRRGRAAADAARGAVEGLAALAPDPGRPPASTFVAAVTDGRRICVAHAGDSRAYWISDGSVAEQLTTDHSWAAEQIALGAPADAVYRMPLAHLITRCLGRPGESGRADVATLPVPRAGWLLLCTDGLWNYLPPAWFLGYRAGHDGRSAETLASQLVAWANAQGGHDNITVGLIRVGPMPGNV